MFIYIYLTSYSLKSQREWKVCRLRKLRACMCVCVFKFCKKKRCLEKKRDDQNAVCIKKKREKKSNYKWNPEEKHCTVHMHTAYRQIDYFAWNHSNQAYVWSVKPHLHYIIQTLLCPDKHSQVSWKQWETKAWWHKECVSLCSFPIIWLPNILYRLRCRWHNERGTKY